MKDLIIYYSWTGHTETVASKIAETIQGELIKIEEKKERKKGLGFAIAAFQALFGLKSKIKKLDINLTEYNRIFIGSPIWAGKGVPAINAFLEKHNLIQKGVYLFFTLQDDKPPIKALEILSKKVRKRGGQVFNTISIRTKMGEKLNPEKVEAKVVEWLQKIGRTHE